MPDLRFKMPLLHLNKICHNLSTQTWTIMIVPSVKGSVTQFKLLKSLIFAGILFLVATGLFLSISGVILLSKNQDLLSIKESAQRELRETQLSFDALELIANKQQQEIEKLSMQVGTSDDYFIRKLSEISELENQLNHMLTLFSKVEGVKTAQSSSAVTSLSTSDLVALSTSDLVALSTSDSVALSTSDSVALSTSRSLRLATPQPLEILRAEGSGTSSGDVLSTEIDSQIQAYESLTQLISNSLDKLEATPDSMPVDGTISSAFGRRKDPLTQRYSFHQGIDIATDYGSPIRAAGTGIITFSGWSGEFGEVLVISHGFGYKSLYAHNAKNLVSVGDLVQKGQLIAKVGTSGKTTGPHLHFEIHANNQEINPLKVIQP